MEFLCVNFKSIESFASYMHQMLSAYWMNIYILIWIWNQSSQFQLSDKVIEL